MSTKGEEEEEEEEFQQWQQRQPPTYSLSHTIEQKSGVKRVSCRAQVFRAIFLLRGLNLNFPMLGLETVDASF